MAIGKLLKRPFLGPALATAALLGVLGLLLERSSRIADVAILLCAIVMILEGIVLVLDWKQRSTAVRRLLSNGRSDVLAKATPLPIIRYVGLGFVVLGVLAVQAGWQSLMR